MYNFVTGLFVAQQAQRSKSFIVLGLSIVVLTFLFILDPGTSIYYAPCPFHALTGFHCPGCGSLRAVHQLLHAHLATAFGLNPLMVLSIPFLAYSFLSYVIAEISGRSLPKVFVPAVFIWIFLGIILLFWVLRNIPLHPFSLLAP